MAQMNPMGQGQAKRNTEKQRQPLFFYALEKEGPGTGQKIVIYSVS